jgi:hypothetical protein
MTRSGNVMLCCFSLSAGSARFAEPMSLRIHPDHSTSSHCTWGRRSSYQTFRQNIFWSVRGYAIHSMVRAPSTRIKYFQKSLNRYFLRGRRALPPAAIESFPGLWAPPHTLHGGFHRFVRGTSSLHIACGSSIRICISTIFSCPASTTRGVECGHYFWFVFAPNPNPS